MRRAGILTAMACLLTTGWALAVIIKPLPLKSILKDATYVCTAKVEKLDPDRPSVILSVDGDLKGKLPFREIPLLLKGDSDAEKLKHTPEMVKRLPKDTPLVLFLIDKKERQVGFAYTNGTWFQFLGEKDGDKFRWNFTHGEPYLRRTFKGTTAEMKQTVEDALSGKKDPPEPNLEEKPGFGPEPKPSTGSRLDPGTAPSTPWFPGRAWEPTSARLCLAAPGHDWTAGDATLATRQSLATCVPRQSLGTSGGPLFAVIPTVVVGGPLAILAMLFPALFGGLMIVLRRWKVLLAVVSVNSTLYMLHAWFDTSIRDYWWGSRSFLWLTLTAISLLGAIWAWWRNLLTRSSNPAEQVPTNAEMWALGIGSGLGLLGVVLMVLWGSPALTNPGWKLLLVLTGGMWAGMLYAMVVQQKARGRTQAKPILPTEGLILWVMVCVSVGLMAGSVGNSIAGGQSNIEGPTDLTGKNPGRQSPPTAVTATLGLLGSPLAQGPLLAATSTNRVTDRRGATLLRQVWKFEPGTQSDVSSSPTVAGNRVYIGLIHSDAFERSGVVYCLDRETGKEVWKFSNDGKMKPMFSSPTVANGKVYIGEGYHDNFRCRLYCLDAATGKKLWDFETQSHTESTPCVVGNRVYFGAGDDGLYCVDADSGAKVWQYPGSDDKRRGLHIDSNPVVVDGRVYCGSGVSRTFANLQVFCLDAATGKPVWTRDDFDLPAWGAPVVSGGRVFVGLGNGRLTLSEEKPRGAVVCLSAEDGRRLWQFDKPKDGVHCRPAVDAHHVYAVSRDGQCYCLERHSGTQVWRHDLGSAAVASPALARNPSCGASVSLYVASTAGDLLCLDPDTGELFWKYDELSSGGPDGKGYAALLLSSPRVELLRSATGERRRIYMASSVNAGTGAVVFCFEDEWNEGFVEQE